MSSTWPKLRGGKSSDYLRTTEWRPPSRRCRRARWRDGIDAIDLTQVKAILIPASSLSNRPDADPQEQSVGGYCDAERPLGPAIKLLGKARLRMTTSLQPRHRRNLPAARRRGTVAKSDFGFLPLDTPPMEARVSEDSPTALVRAV
jgi:hypothetical protein